MGFPSGVSRTPLRMNLIPVTIRPLGRSSALTDEEFRDLAPKDYDESGANDYIVNAQINWKKTGEQPKNYNYTGDENESYGRLVVRKSDLDDAGVSIDKGDLIVLIGGYRVINCRYKIVAREPKGHLNAVPNLLFFRFTEDEYVRETI